MSKNETGFESAYHASRSRRGTARQVGSEPFPATNDTEEWFSCNFIIEVLYYTSTNYPDLRSKFGFVVVLFW